jgi:hypothetical protein
VVVVETDDVVTTTVVGGDETSVVADWDVLITPCAWGGWGWEWEPLHAENSNTMTMVTTITFVLVTVHLLSRVWVGEGQCYDTSWRTPESCTVAQGTSV